jgi:uncharacterized protein (TIGR01777 family)
VINLAGRSVNCRYNRANLDEMMRSRVDSTRVVGQAIAQAKAPPRVWLQASSATIYAHRFDAANDEATGIIDRADGHEPRTWRASVEIIKAWEAELAAAPTPTTRKVALRTGLVLSPDRGSVFDVFCGLARRGLFGPLAGGRQYVSWIHELDFCQALELLIETPELDGAVNLCSPNPLPQAEFARILRRAVGAWFGLPATSWMIELGTWAMRTESELVLKSRRVAPGRLLASGFEFTFPGWTEACGDLLARRPSLR